MVNRLLKLNLRNSILLLGPRGTGKSTLIKDLLKKHKSRALWIDLLRPEEEESLSRSPELLRARIKAEKARLVIIDEVQKIPALLDIAHELIEDEGIQFILTGSSARKLKRGAANLLAGRAFSYHLDPLTHLELDGKFNLDAALQFGLLPKIYYPDPHRPSFKWTASEKTQYLQTYVRTYLKEEVLLEQHVRKITPFRNFLEVAAQMNGKLIDFAKISRDIGVDDKTVAQYYQILEDTLLGFFLRPFHASLRKRQSSKPKFYLFDPGVKRAVDQTLSIPLLERTSAYGEAFEHFVVLELIKLAQIINTEIRFSFFRTSEGLQEIDLIIERPGKAIALIEIKSSTRVDSVHISKLKVFEKAFDSPELYILCQERHARDSNGVRIRPWKRGIQEILGPSSIFQRGKP